MTNKTLSTAQAMRYSRQILLAGFDLDKQEILMNSRILMIGVGGLGCAAAQYLVAAGIGKITIVDDDIVETTNLQRQVLHSEDSIGKKKVASAKDTLSKMNRYVDIHTLDQRQDHEQLASLLLAHDLVLDCSDNLETRNALNEMCYRVGIPLVSGAAIRMEGHIFCVIPALRTACYRCLSVFFGEQNLSCVESGVMSPVVGIIGASQANEAIKILCDFGSAPINTLQMFDAMNSTWERFIVKPNPQCPTCSDNS
ncbi:ThiF family adenylyltransferase [Glaciecola sp. SC05]|uniref:HesA/MoeB/ThiF family protein n=1 Tax=Glaciecola sp. SC05 TaxID=1987355 RepID=UPI0035298FC4